MTETVAPRTATTPPQSVDGAAGPPAPQLPHEPQARAQRPPRTRTGSVWIALVAGAVVLGIVLIFILQNTSAVSINFLGAHLHVSLAVAMLLAAIAGAVIMAAAGTARITQLRQHMRRDRRSTHLG